MLSWSVGEPGAQKQELLVQCTAVPMQQSTLRDLFVPVASSAPRTPC